MPWFIAGLGSVSTTTTTTLNLAAPTGASDGDLLIACIAMRSTATTGITNTGWTLVNERCINNTTIGTSGIASASMLYQIRSGTPDLSFTLPAGNSVATGCIVSYRGNATASLVDTSAAATTAANVTAISVAGMTTAVADDLLVALVAGGAVPTYTAFKSANAPSTASGTTSTTTAPSTTTWTERFDASTTQGADAALGIFDAVKTATGATGSFTATASAGAGHSVIAGAFKIGPPPVTDAWSNADRSANIVLSGSDKSATNTGTGAAVRSTQQYANETAGKYYAEFKIDTLGAAASSRFGIHPLSTAVTTHQGATVNISGAISVSGTGTGTSITAFAVNDIVCLAWDAGAERIWFRNNSGIWNNNGSADPATNTGGIDLSAFAAGNFALWYHVISTTAAAVTIRTELAEYTQTIPSGFTSWMGEATTQADAWSSADKSAGVTLSNADKTAAAAATSNAVRSTTANTNGTAGKYYAEFYYPATPAVRVGISPTSNVLTANTLTWQIVGGSVFINSADVSVFLGTSASGDVISVAWDAGAERVWFRKNAGNWNNNASYDPATGTGGLDVSASANTPHALWSSICDSATARSVTLRTELAEYTQTVPSGFFSWMGEAPSIADAWNVNDKSPYITLSDGDKTATFPTGGTYNIRSTTKYASATAGKYYAEFLLTTKNTGDNYGIQNASGSLVGFASTATATVVYDDGSITHLDGSVGSIGSTFSNGDVVCIAWDAGAEKIWFRKNGGNWNGSGTANPATGAEGIDTSSAANVDHALFQNYADGGTAVTTLRTELAEYTQTVPSGFTSWMGETPSVGDIDVPVTGVEATGAVGPVTVTAVTSVSVPVTGVEATGQVGTATVTISTPVSVPVTGVAAAGAIDSVTVAGRANVSTTGVAASGSVNAVTVAGRANTAVTGVEAAGSAGSVSVAGKASASVTGVSAAGSVGTVTIVGKANVPITGVEATGAVGTVTVSTTTRIDISVPVTGVEATGSVNGVTVIGRASVTVIGVQGTGSVGTVTATAGVGVSTAVTGVGASASVDSVTVTGRASVAVATATAPAISLPTPVTGANTTVATTASFTPAASSLLVAVVSSRPSTASLPTITDSLGGTWTPVTSSDIEFGNVNARLWTQVQGASPSARTVTGTSTGAAQTNIGIVQLTGANTADFSNFVTDTDTAGDPSLTMAAYGGSSLCLAIMVGNAGTTGSTQPNGFTELYDALPTSNLRMSIAYDDSGPDTALAWVSNSTDSVGYGLEIKPSSAAGLQATGSVGTVTTVAGISVSVAATSVQGTGSVGDVAVTGRASVPLTGVTATSGLGNVSVTAGGSISTGATGVQATGSVGSVTVLLRGDAVVTGVSAAGSVGSVTTSGKAVMAATGVLATAAVGSVSVIAGASEAIADAWDWTRTTGPVVLSNGDKTATAEAA